MLFHPDGSVDDFDSWIARAVCRLAEASGNVESPHEVWPVRAQVLARHPYSPTADLPIANARVSPHSLPGAFGFLLPAFLLFLALLARLPLRRLLGRLP